MPLYEYICESDGQVIELIRPMADADKPIMDPAGKGRTFTRKLSTFAAKAGFAAKGSASAASSAPSTGGGCACGKPHGGCGRA